MVHSNVELHSNKTFVEEINQTGQQPLEINSEIGIQLMETKDLRLN